MKHLFTRSRRIAAAITVAALVGTSVSAQMSYSRSYFGGTYTPVSGSATALTFSSLDDGTAMIALPFNFTYNNTAYVAATNYLAVCTNGWAAFTTTNTSPSTTQTNGNFYTTATPMNVMAPWWDDLNLDVVGSNSAGGASWEVTGSAPNRVMTVQWVASAFYGTLSGQPRQLNFQVKLYETTNVIEFWYGNTVGTTMNTDESATIGLKDAVGGNGHYLDGITGSAFTGNTFLQANQFPKFQMRFTPGAPTPLPAGTYTVGVGQTYRNITDAFADVNNRGVAGAVVLNLVDALYDTTAAGGNNIFPLLLGPVSGVSAANTVTVTKSSTPAVIQWGGVRGTGTFMVNQASTTALSGGTDPIVGLVGADRITLNNLDIRGNIGARLVDHGIGVYNSSATDGAQNNTFTNITTTMNRANTGSIGIRQQTLTTATSAAGANSFNVYKGLIVKSSYVGIQLTGTAGFPDDACEIGTNACGTFNVIGDPLTTNDIGNGSNQTWGIRATNQSNVSIYNNIVTNVTGTGAVAIDAIFVDNSSISAGVSAGACQVYNNNIAGISGTSTGTSVVRGIRCGLNGNAGSSSRIYNNTITGLNSASTSTSSRRVIGISIQDGGSGAGSTHNVDFNSVRIAPAVASCSNTCFEIGTASGPVINVRNNVFANFTGAQTTVKHYCWVSTSATAIGNTGSASNYNDLYVSNTTNGFVALGNTTDYATLAAWQGITATPDLNSITVDPIFSSPLDLHASAAALDNAGNNTGIPWVTIDMDCQVRPLPAATNFDIGADELIACAGTPTAGTVTITPGSVCGSGVFTMQMVGASTGVGISYQWKESATAGGPYTNSTTGSGFATSSYTTAAISATRYYVCVVTCANSGMTATTAELVANVLPLPPVAVSPTTGTVCSGGSGTTLTASGASTYSWSPSSGLNTTTGSTVIANPSSNTTYTVVGTGSNGCTATASSTLTVVEMPSLLSLTATPATVCSGGSSQLQVNAALTTSYVQTTVPYLPINSGSGTVVLASNGTATTAQTAGTLDDGYWNGITLPFTFNFYGAAYSSISIQTNGAASLVPFTTTTGYNVTMPNTAAPNTLLAPCFGDLDWRFGGVISYYTSGSAPNRVFVINYNGSTNGGFYNSGLTPTALTVFQIQLFEGTNIIQYHTTSIPTNSTNHAQGIENAAGTAAVVVSGRNNTTWTAANDAVQFAPSGTGSLTYSWTPPTFLNSTTIANPLASSITASTTYSVSVSNGACSATGSVTVTAGAALTANGSISPASSVCAGTTVTLNSTPVGGGSPYSFAWTGPNSFTSTAQSPVLNNTTVAQSGVYTLVVTDNCAATYTITMTLTVNPPPAVAVTPTSATFCTSGPGIGLSASGANSYTWGPAAGLSSTTGANVTATPSVTTTYTVTGVDGNGCSATASAAITSSAGITGASATVSPTTICVGAAVNLTATSNGLPTVLVSENFNAGAPTWTRTNTSTGGTPANAAWIDRPDGFVYGTGPAYHSNDNSQFVQTNSDAQGSGSTTRTTLQSPAFSTVGVTNVVVSFYQFYRDINDNGDSAVIEASLNNINWTIVDAQTATSGSEAAFNNRIVTLPPAYNNQATVYIRFRYIATWDWYWSIDNVTISGDATSSITYNWSSSPASFSSTLQNPTDNPTVNTSYNVVFSTPGGCTASASTATVTVNALPTVTANTTAAAVCDGNAVTLTGGGATSYAWTNSVTDNVPFVPSVTDTYTVTGTDANGCTNTASVMVTVNALPAVTATASSSAVCDGSQVTFNGGGATSYSWSGGVMDNVPYTPVMTDSYTVTGTDANGCTNTASVMVTVNALPTVTATASASTVCAGDSVVVNGGGASTYAWSGGVTDNVAFIPVATDTYTVTGTDGNGCQNTASVMVTVNAAPNVTLSLPVDTACTNVGTLTLGGESPAGGTWSGPGVTGNVFDPNTAGVGTHTITYTYIDPSTGCSAMATDNIEVDICSGIVNAEPGTAVIYPNPNNGDFTLIPSGSGMVDVMIYSATGQLVAAQKVACGQQTQVSLEASGMYSVVIVTADGHRTTQRVIVNR